MSLEKSRIHYDRIIETVVLLLMAPGPHSTAILT
jgi:hypothetical protein